MERRIRGNEIVLICYQAMNNISSLAGNFPTGEDLTGAAAGLMRLQDTYKLDTKSMAKGEFGGVKVAAEMSTQVRGADAVQCENKKCRPLIFCQMKHLNLTIGLLRPRPRCV